MGEHDAGRVVDTVSKRVDLLDLLQHGVIDKSQLVETLGVSRSTIDRAIRELEEFGLIERRQGGFRLTALGHLFFRHHRERMEVAAGLVEAAPLLASLGTSVEPSTALFRSPTVVFTGNDPHRFANYVAGALASAERVSIAWGPARVDVPVDVKRILAALDASFVVSRSGLEWFRTYHLDGRCAREHKVHVVGESFPYGLVVIERPVPHVLLTAHDETDAIVGVLSNDDRDAVAWGRRHFDWLAENAVSTVSVRAK